MQGGQAKIRKGPLHVVWGFFCGGGGFVVAFMFVMGFTFSN